MTKELVGTKSTYLMGGASHSLGGSNEPPDLANIYIYI